VARQASITEPKSSRWRILLAARPRLSLCQSGRYGGLYRHYRPASRRTRPGNPVPCLGLAAMHALSRRRLVSPRLSVGLLHGRTCVSSGRFIVVVIGAGLLRADLDRRLATAPGKDGLFRKHKRVLSASGNAGRHWNDRKNHVSDEKILTRRIQGINSRNNSSHHPISPFRGD